MYCLLKSQPYWRRDRKTEEEANKWFTYVAFNYRQEQATHGGIIHPSNSRSG